MNAERRRLLACYARFCVVGVSGLAVDMALLVFLHHGMGWGLVPSKLVAAEVALLSNFGWNEVWTFRGLHARPDGRGSRLLSFHLICLAGIGISLALLKALADGLAWSVWLANPVAILTVSVWNFGLSWLWGWRGAGRRDCPS